MSSAIRVLQGQFGRIALLNMDHPLVNHAHSQCHVLIKVGGSDTFFRVGNKYCPLNADTAVLINAWEPHAYTHHNHNAPHTVILAFYIEPLWLSEIDKSFISSQSPNFFPQPCVHLPPQIRALSESLATTMLYGGQISDDALQTQLSNLMVLVIDAFSEWRSTTYLSAYDFPLIHDSRIRRAISYMRANAGSKVDTAALASEACLSRAHFFKLFREQTNLTPTLYNNILRVEAAIHGITDTRESMSTLSANLGFNAQSHFTRFFQQHTGVLPSQYRQVVDVYQANKAP